MDAPSRRFRLTLEYDGSGFAGWQQQPPGQRTVQGVLHEAFAALPGRHSRVHAAGRTDTGVHALAMVAHVDSDTTIPADKFGLALDAHLPDDVAVLRVEPVPATFEAQYGCCYRRYLYRLQVVRDDRRGVALERRRVLAVHDRLDVRAMQEAAAHVQGRRDFAAFATRETRTTVRTVTLCQVRVAGREVHVHVAADGFLRTMVRTLVGTLLDVGTHRRSPSDVVDVLAARERRGAGKTVPAHGLYFVEAGYEPWDEAVSESRFPRGTSLPGP
ncbi:tRNA pseudouridine(38-40) synthase TruA [soil metagenome]